MYEKELDKIGQEIVTGSCFNQDRHATREAVLNVLNRIAIGGHLEKKELSIFEDLEVYCPPANSLTATAPPTKKTTVWLMPNLETINDSETAEHSIARAFAEAITSEKDTPSGKVEPEISRLLSLWGFRPTSAEQAARAGAAA